jgi:hypothetical protein
MSRLQYPRRITKEEAEKAFLSKNINVICDALLSAIFYINDWKWCQEHCFEFLENQDPEISGLAATCIGHIARIHKNLAKQKAVEKLKNHLSSQTISGQVQDALDDIEIFLK